MDDTSWSYWLNATRERKPGHPSLYLRVYRSRFPLAGTLNGDLDAAVLCPALRRIVRGDGSGVAEALGRNIGRRNALRYQKSRHIGGPPRRQRQIVRDPLLLQRGPDWKIVGIAIDDDFGVRGKVPELRDDVVGELRLTGGA